MAVQDFGPTLNGVMWASVVIATAFVAARMYTRHYIINAIGWDDIIMVVNLVCTAILYPFCIDRSVLVFMKRDTDIEQATLIGYVACISVGVTYGIGRKFATVPPQDYSKAIMWEAIGQGICIMGIAASKGSVALFLLRIVILRWHKVALWFCIISTTIICIVTTVLLFLQCKPTAFLWDQTIAGGVCWLNFTIVGLFMGCKLSNETAHGKKGIC